MVLRSAFSAIHRLLFSEVDSGPAPAFHTASPPSTPKIPTLGETIPLLPADDLLAANHGLIRDLSYSLDFEPDDFDRIMRPVLIRLASIVHLLPASATHHHRDAGGLLRHSLEAAVHAARLSDDAMVITTGFAHQRHLVLARWRVAACLAAMLHDVGKVRTLLQVFASNDEGAEWEPGRETLIDWGHRLRISHYVIRWRNHSSSPVAYESHERIVAQFRDAIVGTPDLSAWLWELGPDAANEMLGVLSGSHNDGKMAEIVKAADMISTQRDRKRTGASLAMPMPGLPIEQHVLEAMRTLLSEGHWRVNVPDGKVWHLADGDDRALFISWKASIPSLVAWLKSNGTTGIPEDPDSLAHILAECGQLVTRILPTGAPSVYWPVRPPSQDGKAAPASQMIRIADPGMLLPLLPPALSSSFRGANSPRFGASDPQPPARSSHDTGNSHKPTTARSSVEPGPPDSDMPPHLESPPLDAYTDELQEMAPPAPSKASPRPREKAPTASLGTIPVQKKCPECGNIATWSEDAYACNVCGVITSEEAMRAAEAAAIATMPKPKKGTAGPAKSASDTAVRDDILASGEIGQLVLRMIEDTALGRRKIGELIDFHNSEVWLIYPALRNYNRWNRQPTDPDLTLQTIAGMLQEAKWIESNPHYPDQLLQERNNKKILMFTRTMSAKILASLEETTRRVAEKTKPMADLPIDLPPSPPPAPPPEPDPQSAALNPDFEEEADRENNPDDIEPPPVVPEPATAAKPKAKKAPSKPRMTKSVDPALMPLPIPVGPVDPDAFPPDAVEFLKWVEANKPMARQPDGGLFYSAQDISAYAKETGANGFVLQGLMGRTPRGRLNDGFVTKWR